MAGNPAWIAQMNTPYAGPGTGAGLMRVNFQLEKLLALTRRGAQDATRARAAIMRAHDMMAYRAQVAIVYELQLSIEQTGRVQRQSQKLVRALESQRVRKVRPSGWTVGYLEEIPEVREYARNLETGTRVHVGRVVYGHFMTEGSSHTAMAIRRNERFKFTDYTDTKIVTSSPRYRIKIRRPIRPYGYFRKGIQQYRREEGGRFQVGTYKAAFAQDGLDFFALWFAQYPTPPKQGDARLSKTINAAR